MYIYVRMYYTFATSTNLTRNYIYRAAWFHANIRNNVIPRAIVIQGICWYYRGPDKAGEKTKYKKPSNTGLYSLAEYYCVVVVAEEGGGIISEMRISSMQIPQ